MNKVFCDYKFKLCWLDKICAKLFFYRHYKLCKQLGYLDMFWCAISWYCFTMDLCLRPTFWWDEYCSEPVILSISDIDGALYDRLRFKRGELYELWQDQRTQKTYRFYPGNVIKEC